jgi:hypothetical protein
MEPRNGMEDRKAFLMGCVLVCSLLGCAGPRPILYPNAHYKEMGEEAAKQDIADCRRMAEAAGADSDEDKAGQAATRAAVGAGTGAAAGAVGGAIVGAAGSGSAVGAASGAVWSLFGWLLSPSQPSSAHVRFVDRCLKDKGYEPVGWQ